MDSILSPKEILKNLQINWLNTIVLEGSKKRGETFSATFWLGLLQEERTCENCEKSSKNLWEFRKTYKDILGKSLIIGWALSCSEGFRNILCIKYARLRVWKPTFSRISCSVAQYSFLILPLVMEAKEQEKEWLFDLLPESLLFISQYFFGAFPDVYQSVFSRFLYSVPDLLIKIKLIKSIKILSIYKCYSGMIVIMFACFYCVPIMIRLTTFKLISFDRNTPHATYVVALLEPTCSIDVEWSRVFYYIRC